MGHSRWNWMLVHFCHLCSLENKLKWKNKKICKYKIAFEKSSVSLKLCFLLKNAAFPWKLFSICSLHYRIFNKGRVKENIYNFGVIFSEGGGGYPPSVKISYFSQKNINVSNGIKLEKSKLEKKFDPVDCFRAMKKIGNFIVKKRSFSKKGCQGSFHKNVGFLWSFANLICLGDILILPGSLLLCQFYL